eukprot:scaffold1025_cov102-Cylindrotheca_fusiformis.AAC.5
MLQSVDRIIISFNDMAKLQSLREMLDQSRLYLQQWTPDIPKERHPERPMLDMISDSESSIEIRLYNS